MIAWDYLSNLVKNTTLRPSDYIPMFIYLQPMDDNSLKRHKFDGNAFKKESVPNLWCWFLVQFNEYLKLHPLPTDVILRINCREEIQTWSADNLNYQQSP